MGPVDRLAAFLTDVVAHTGPFAPVVLLTWVAMGVAATLAIGRALLRRRKVAR